jgi:hypothetical protein
MCKKDLILAAIAGAIAISVSTVIWFGGFKDAGPTPVQLKEPTSLECNCGEESSCMTEQEPLKIPAQEPQEAVNSKSNEGDLSNLDAKIPIKENDKNTGRVIKKKVQIPAEVQTSDNEEQNHTKESQKDLVEGRFGTHFESDYGE